MFFDGGRIYPIVSNNYHYHYYHYYYHHSYCFDGGRIYPIVSNYLGLKTIKGDIRRAAGGGRSPYLLFKKEKFFVHILKENILWPKKGWSLGQSSRKKRFFGHLLKENIFSLHEGWPLALSSEKKSFFWSIY